MNCNVQKVLLKTFRSKNLIDVVKSRRVSSPTGDITEDNDSTQEGMVKGDSFKSIFYEI